MVLQSASSEKAETGTELDGRAAEQHGGDVAVPSAVPSQPLEHPPETGVTQDTPVQASEPDEELGQGEAKEQAGHTGAPQTSEPALTEHQRRWLELHAACKREPDDGMVESTSGRSDCTQLVDDSHAEPPLGDSSRQQQQQQVETAVEHGTPFVASGAWAGARAGYVFKTGAQGLGYYLDAAPVATACNHHTSCTTEGPSQQAAARAAVTLQPRLRSRVADELD
jgi:hypothetical protein